MPVDDTSMPVADAARHALTGRRVVEASDGAVRAAADPRTLPRRRQPTDERAVLQTAETLFDRVDPTDPASYRRVLRREVARFYAPTVVGDLDLLLAEVVTNGARLYLQGAALGVGASTLVTDYARAFNTICRTRRDRRRMAYIPFGTGIDTPRKFFAHVARRVRTPLPVALTRNVAAPEDYAAAILCGAVNNGVTAMILDHPGRLAPRERALIGDLLEWTDPACSVDLDGVGGDIDDEPAGRIAVVIVDHHRPETAFMHAPEALARLEGTHAVLPPYTTREEVAHALVQAEVGYDEFDVGRSEDRAVADLLLEHTSGLTTHLAAVLRRIDAAHLQGRRARPTLDSVARAIQAHRPMIRLYEVRVGRQTEYLTAADDGTPELADDPAGRLSARRYEGGGRAPTPAATLDRDHARAVKAKLKRYDAKGATELRAREEAKALRRKGHVVLPSSRKDDGPRALSHGLPYGSEDQSA